MKPLFSRQSLRRPARGTVAAMLACIAGVTSVAPACAQTAAAQPDPKAILMRMADFMSKLPSFSVDVRDSYDTVQNSGQKIEFSETRMITVVRPDRMRLEVVESDGDQQTLVIDAKDISLTSQPANVYAQTPSPGNLDQAIVFFVRDLGMRLPFAALLVKNARAELKQRTKTLDYVEKTNIRGAPAYHLAGRAQGVDFQVWVTAGDKPLPLKLVLTYLEEKAQPQFRAEFSDWNVAPQLSDATFAFTPPEGSHRIAFVAEMPRGAAPKAASTPKPGSSAKPGVTK